MAGELAAAAKKVRTLPNQMVKAGTKTVAGPLKKAYLHDAGGDGALSGLRNSGTFKATTSVRGTYDVKGKVTIGPPSMRGPATWLNDGARRSKIGRTVAKHTFDRTVTAELPEAERVMVRMFDDALR